MIAHVNEPFADRESQPDPAGRMAVGAGLDRNSEDFCPPAHRNGVTRNVLEPRQNRFGRITRPPPDSLENPQSAGGLGMAMAENDRVDTADRVKIRHSAGFGTLAAIEQQAATPGLHHKGCRLLGPKT